MTEVTVERPFHTVKSAAKLLSVSETKVRAWVRSGELPSYNLGDLIRIDPSDIESFLANRRKER